jgi:hypothetical protein
MSSKMVTRVHAGLNEPQRSCGKSFIGLLVTPELKRRATAQSIIEDRTLSAVVIDALKNYCDAGTDGKQGG